VETVEAGWNVLVGCDPVKKNGDWAIYRRTGVALAGRVPVKATTENGPIRIGDFLTTSSKPGYAMRCGELSKCTGAILGKALEPLEEGRGTIMVQVTLR